GRPAGRRGFRSSRRWPTPWPTGGSASRKRTSDGRPEVCLPQLARGCYPTCFPALSQAEESTVRIAVIGTGYVGLVTATCLAESGNDVVGIDKDARKIEMLEAGKLPIYEPGLLELVLRNRREVRLTFTTDLARGVAA